MNPDLAEVIQYNREAALNYCAKCGVHRDAMDRFVYHAVCIPCGNPRAWDIWQRTLPEAK